MCGIAGCISRNPITAREQLLAMQDAMSHRGPDDSGVWWSPDCRVGLAHRRLSIIDLSRAGHQPMSDASGRVWVTFNGEIYNFMELRKELQALGHSFRSESDTEVIIAAWREWKLDCVAHMNGMFAFCIYDDALKKLFLARDRAGEKPLFYHESSGNLVFASELKALMANPGFDRRVDIESMNHYLAYGYVPGDMCLLRGVRKLGQGEALTFDLSGGDVHVWRYWQLPEPLAEVSCDLDEKVDLLEGLLMESVRLRMIADVPIGILLSGGIDSSLVTALAARVASNTIKTFTITFPGHGAYDETAYARIVASHLGTEHTELVAEPETVDLLPVLAKQFDEPIADSSMVPTFLVSRLIREHATVALNGDGGDELFGGYNHYSWIVKAGRWRWMIPFFMNSVIRSAVAKYVPVGFKGRNYLVGLSRETGRMIANVDVYFDAYSRRQLLSTALQDAAPAGPSPETYKADLASHTDSPLQQAMVTDFMTYMVDDILTKVDRASMLNSLEMRAPWLDHRIIEFAFGQVPDALKATGKERKILPRRLAQRLLPKELDLNRKQGFSIPLASWYKGDWGRYIVSVLNEADPSFFNRKYIQKLIAYQRHGCNNVKRLFALTMFELWRREYKVQH